MPRSYRTLTPHATMLRRRACDALAAAKIIAVVGASPNPARPVYGVMQLSCSAPAIRVIPVNPGQEGQEILGAACVRPPRRYSGAGRSSSISSAGRRRLPALSTRRWRSTPLPKAIWMQLDLRDDAAAAKARGGRRHRLHGPLHQGRARPPLLIAERFMREAGYATERRSAAPPFREQLLLGVAAAVRRLPIDTRRRVDAPSHPKGGHLP